MPEENYVPVAPEAVFCISNPIKLENNHMASNSHNYDYINHNKYKYIRATIEDIITISKGKKEEDYKLTIERSLFKKMSETFKKHFFILEEIEYNEEVDYNYYSNDDTNHMYNTYISNYLFDYQYNIINDVILEFQPKKEILSDMTTKRMLFKMINTIVLEHFSILEKIRCKEGEEVDYKRILVFVKKHEGEMPWPFL
jgi:hypothetical protein